MVENSLEGLLVLLWPPRFYGLKLFLRGFDFGYTQTLEVSDTYSDELAFLDFEAVFKAGFLNFGERCIFRLRNGEAIAD